MKKRVLVIAILMISAATRLLATDVLINYGDFEQWITRTVKESKMVGGNTVTFYEIGPTGTWPENTPYTPQGGSPWGTSNVYAKVTGIVKANVSLYQDTHGSGKCVKIETNELTCKAAGILNITVIATGSLFTGYMVEPITSSSNPMEKMDLGIPFTRRPKAIKFDYKVKLSDADNRLYESGFGKKEEIPGKDCCEAFVLLQKRWEDSKGNIHAKRVGTMWQRFTEDCDWNEGASFDIQYGDISGSSYYQSFMELENNKSDRAYYTKNSKGKMVMIQEEGWADDDEAPTHIIVVFNSSHGRAYEGSPGNTMWIDNVKLVY